eukprot:gene31376-6535_t
MGDMFAPSKPEWQADMDDNLKRIEKKAEYRARAAKLSAEDNINQARERLKEKGYPQEDILQARDRTVAPLDPGCTSPVSILWMYWGQGQVEHLDPDVPSPDVPSPGVLGDRLKKKDVNSITEAQQRLRQQDAEVLAYVRSIMARYKKGEYVSEDELEFAFRQLETRFS